MKFAIPLSMLPMDEIKPLGIAADEIGYDYLAVSDHLIHPENFSVPYPYTDDGSVRWEQGTDWPDPINSLSFLAGATSNIRFIPVFTFSQQGIRSELQKRFLL